LRISELRLQCSALHLQFHNSISSDATRIKKQLYLIMCILLIMEDQVFMYAMVAGVFVVLTGILFWSRASRKSEERKSTSTITSGERKGAI
ncbi:MAG: hypothetical protein WCF07_14850, partial [Nitrososphaeraceae archaeon]